MTSRGLDVALVRALKGRLGPAGCVLKDAPHIVRRAGALAHGNERS